MVVQMTQRGIYTRLHRLNNLFETFGPSNHRGSFETV